MLLNAQGKPITPTKTTRDPLSVGKTQWGGNPFVSLGLDWCPRCQQEVDSDTAANYRAGIYSYKRWCKRCGRAIKYGAYQVQLIRSEGLPAAVFEWMTKPEQDRR